MKKLIVIVVMLAMAVVTNSFAIEAWEKPMSDQQQYATLLDYHQHKVTYALGIANMAVGFYISAQMAGDSAGCSDAIDDLNEAMDYVESEIDYVNYYLSFISFTALSKEKQAEYDQLLDMVELMRKRVRGLQ